MNKLSGGDCYVLMWIISGSLINLWFIGNIIYYSLLS